MKLTAFFVAATISLVQNACASDAHISVKNRVITWDEDGEKFQGEFRNANYSDVAIAKMKIIIKGPIISATLFNLGDNSINYHQTVRKQFKQTYQKPTAIEYPTDIEILRSYLEKDAVMQCQYIQIYDTKNNKLRPKMVRQMNIADPECAECGKYSHLTDDDMYSGLGACMNDSKILRPPQSIIEQGRLAFRAMFQNIQQIR